MTSFGTGAGWTEYVWLGAMPLAQIDAGTIYYTHADHLGSPQALTDGSKAIVWDAAFRPFGEVEAVSGAVTQNLRFPGQYFDAETGTHYNYFRDYDPALGRYLQSDPIGLAGGLNTYAYVGGNPLSFVDPRGLSAANCMRPGFGPCRGFETRAIPFGGGMSVRPSRPGGSSDVGSRRRRPGIPSILEALRPAIPNFAKRDCDKGDEERCKKVLEKCRRICTDAYVDDPNSLPGTGPDMPGRIRRCIRDCMESHNCPDY